MKIKTEIELQPFSVPNFVIPMPPIVLRQDGWKPVDSIPIADVPEDVLLQLCRQFVMDVFNKGNKPVPFSILITSDLKLGKPYHE